MRARPLSKDEKSQRWVPRSLADGLAKPPGESASPSRLSGKLLISQDPSVPLLPSPRGHRLGGRPREEGPRWQTRWIAKPGIWTRGMLSQPLRGLGCLIKGSSVNNTVPQYLQSRWVRGRDCCCPHLPWHAAPSARQVMRKGGGPGDTRLSASRSDSAAWEGVGVLSGTSLRIPGLALLTLWCPVLPFLLLPIPKPWLCLSVSSLFPSESQWWMNPWAVCPVVQTDWALKELP